MRVGMQNYVDPRVPVASNRGESGGDRPQTFTPIFAPVTRDKDARQPFDYQRCGNWWNHAQQSVDAGVPGHVNLSGNRLGAQVGAAVWVGANSKLARASMAVRYSSSGQGISGSCVLNPASTCATGTPTMNAASAAPKALDVSPCTISRSGAGCNSGRRASLTT
jgi:hypothetical protein